MLTGPGGTRTSAVSSSSIRPKEGAAAGFSKIPFPGLFFGATAALIELAVFFLAVTHNVTWQR